jgi:hypothetical protein
MGPEDVEPIRAIDLMREYHIIRQPGINEEEYDIDALEFTEEFNHSMDETLLRLASDSTNKSLNLNEGLLSIINNFIGSNADISKDEREKIKMMVFSLKTVQDESK